MSVLLGATLDIVRDAARPLTDKAWEHFVGLLGPQL